MFFHRWPARDWSRHDFFSRAGRAAGRDMISFRAKNHVATRDMIFRQNKSCRDPAQPPPARIGRDMIFFVRPTGQGRPAGRAMFFMIFVKANASTKS